MSDPVEAYDLGDVALEEPRRPAPSWPPDTRVSPGGPRVPGLRRTATGPAGGSVAHASLSLFLPGGGHLLRGEVAVGLCYLTSIAFLGALGWAIAETFDRLTSTLELLDWPRAAALWALPLLYYLAGLVHLAGVLGATAPAGDAETPAGPHPALAGLASAVLPGWGQILNGNRRRAILLLGALWAIGATWILASAPVEEIVAASGVRFPRQVLLATSPEVRWMASAVLWTAAVCDAAATAARRR